MSTIPQISVRTGRQIPVWCSGRRDPKSGCRQKTRSFWCTNLCLRKHIIQKEENNRSIVNKCLTWLHQVHLWVVQNPGFFSQDRALFTKEDLAPDCLVFEGDFNLQMPLVSVTSCWKSDSLGAFIWFRSAMCPKSTESNLRWESTKQFKPVSCSNEFGLQLLKPKISFLWCLFGNLAFVCHQTVSQGVRTSDFQTLFFSPFSKFGPKGRTEGGTLTRFNPCSTTIQLVSTNKKENKLICGKLISHHTRLEWSLDFRDFSFEENLIWGSQVSGLYSFEHGTTLFVRVRASLSTR